jgi:peptide/nickel transport system permease protein
MRGLQSVIVLLVVGSAVFLISHATGDPAALSVPIEANRESFERARSELGLDRPLVDQYTTYLGNAVTGDFGQSIRQRRPVIDVILERAPNSIRLAFGSIFVALALGIPLGVFAARRQGTAFDGAARLVALIGQSTPAFFLGIILVVVFSVRFHLLPTGGAGGLSHYVLPCVTLGAAVMAGVVRLLRASVLDVLDMDFVRLARIKGEPERVVIWRHVVRNAILPVVTFTGLMLGSVVAAAIAVEQVFAWPGIGRLTYDAVVSRDFPLLQGLVVFWTGFVLLVNFGVDLLYARIDPRIRY